MAKSEWVFFKGGTVRASGKTAIINQVKEWHNAQISMNWFDRTSNEEKAALDVYPVNHAAADPLVYQTVGYGGFTIDSNNPVVISQNVIVTDWPFDRAKEDACRVIKEKRDEIHETWPISYDGFIFQGDRKSETRMMDAVDLLRYQDSTALPPGPNMQAWRDIDNVWRGPYTADQLEAMRYQKGVQSQTAWNNFAVLESAIMAAADLPALRALDLQAGWPTNPSL